MLEWCRSDPVLLSYLISVAVFGQLRADEGDSGNLKNGLAHARYSYVVEDAAAGAWAGAGVGIETILLW